MRVSVKLQNRLSLRENADLARRAEVAGLDGVWVSEYADRDAVTQLAVLASSTTTITVGASVIPIYTRSAVVLGMTLASLSELAPDRLVLGLGTSSDVIVRSWHGLDRRSPLAAMREYVDVVRSVPGGARLDVAGTAVSSTGFRYLTPELVGRSQVAVAALGPAMCRLAGEVGDAVLLNLVSATDVPRLRGLVAEGAARAARAAPPLVADVRIGISGRQDREELTASLRRLVASYGRVGPYYAHYARSGFTRQAEALREAWEAGDDSAASSAVDDDMLTAMTAVGSPDEVVEHLRRLEAAGLDEAILYPSFTGADERTGVLEAIDVATLFRDSPHGV